MSAEPKTSRTIHESGNVKRPDSYQVEMPGIKLDTLATMLHGDRTQVSISRIEQNETIDTPLLQQISAALKIPVEAIQNFDEEQAVNIIANTFNEEAFIANSGSTYHINPIEKNIQLHEEKIVLYERML